MNRSTNFQFYLPENTDPISIDDINANFENIDGKLAVANNLTTTAAGKVLDARQGKILNDSITTLEGMVKPSNTLANNTNLNDVTTTKVCLLASSRTYSNCPVSTGILDVAVADVDGYLVQRIYTASQFWFRYKWFSTWGDWVRVPVGYSTSSFSVTYAGHTETVSLYRSGNVVRVRLAIGNGTAFADATGNDNVGTMPSGWRPYDLSAQIIGHARTSGTWANATFYPVILLIDSNGGMSIRGNGTNLKTCHYIVFDGTYTI